jgi:hypothetical protein
MKQFISVLVALTCHCAATQILISVPEQKMAVTDGVKELTEYRVSTSRYGTGEFAGSRRTPVGLFRIVEKIGAGAAPGTVFIHRRQTNHVISPAGHRAAIITRILRLNGLDAWNANTADRGIYIHGTLDWHVGVPRSIGCIGMRSADVIRLFDTVDTNTVVRIADSPLKTLLHEKISARLPSLGPQPQLAGGQCSDCKGRNPTALHRRGYRHGFRRGGFYSHQVGRLATASHQGRRRIHSHR